MADTLTRKKRFLFLMFLVLAVSFILRFWRLSSYPPSLSMDEVSFGYNAYSILKTGRDEFGKFLPLSFKALQDYKPPVDVYLTSFSIALFGKNEFAVRFPVALLGSLTPILLILFLQELKFSRIASLLTGLWASVLGWHIFYSRASFEAIAALFFLVLGTLLFFKWIKRSKSFFLSLSVLFLGLSLWTYNAERVFVPFFVGGLVFLYRQRVKRVFKNDSRSFILPITVGVLLVFPLVYLLFSGVSISGRAIELWLTKDPAVSSILHNGTYVNFKEFIFDNDLYLIFRSWVGQYLNYLDLRFWFWKGVMITPPDYQDVGLFYLIDFPVFLIGIYYLLKSKNRNLKNFAFIWFLLGPLPGSFTRGEESPIRVLVWLPFFALVMAQGFEGVSSFRSRGKILAFYLLFLAANAFYFFDTYLNNFHKFYSDLWHYGYKEVAKYSCENYQKYEKVVVTDKYGIEFPRIKAIPHLYILFHCDYDPALYLRKKEIYNLEIRQPQWRIDSRLNNALLIGSPWDFPEGFDQSKVFKKIYFPNGKEAFYFVETSRK